MLFLQGKVCMGSCAIMIVFIIFSTLYAYKVNAKRAADDPEKKNYPLLAVWLVPVTLPILILIDVLTLILSSLLFGLFLLLFPFALLLFRKPFLIKWILKLAQRIGKELLEVNTELLKAVGIYPTSIKLQVER